MKKPPAYWYRAKRILSKRDPILRKIIKKFNKGFLTTRKDPFFSLCRTIVGQQISTKAADSIWSKFEIKCKKKNYSNQCIKIDFTLFKERRFIASKNNLFKKYC